ncbi:MAG: hypothetical protein Q9160_008298 [Pyrenula sp. 1 TL-2023]
MAGIDRLSTQSLWSLMGLMIRNAEKLGIHRDGALVGLFPVETEERRRLWWQLQHLDLALAVRAGLTPLTLMADWDAKLPLNIEDDDINPSMTDPPQERKGLTSMSWNLYTYWVIYQQRLSCCDKGRFELSWQSNGVKSLSSKDSLIEQLEAGLNKNFLQYCDPIRPLDTLIQLSARSLIFMCVIVEASRQNDTSKTERIWALLSELYSTNPSLSQLSKDRRRSYAAGLIVNAWKARQNKLEVSEKQPTPDFVTQLDAQLADCWAEATHKLSTEEVQQEGGRQSGEDLALESFLTDQEFNAMFNLDFQDIDWSFWSSID